MTDSTDKGTKDSYLQPALPEPEIEDIAFLAARIFRPNSADTETIPLNEAVKSACFLWRESAKAIRDWTWLDD